MQKDAKEACERALEAKNLPLEIALENLNAREGRQEFDVVKDEVEAQLQTEVQLIENIKVLRSLVLILLIGIGAK